MFDLTGDSRTGSGGRGGKVDEVSNSVKELEDDWEKEGGNIDCDKCRRSLVGSDAGFESVLTVGVEGPSPRVGGKRAFSVDAGGGIQDEECNRLAECRQAAL